MFLLFFTTILSFLSASTSTLTKPLIQWLNRPTKKEQLLHKNITHLQKEQSQFSMVDNFAAHAKLQRKINGLKTELSNIASERTSSKYTTQLSISIGTKIFTGIIMLITAYSCRYVPIYVFPKNFDFFPVNSIISYPNQIPGSVSVHFWLMVTNCVARQIIK